MNFTRPNENGKTLSPESKRLLNEFEIEFDRAHDNNGEPSLVAHYPKREPKQYVTLLKEVMRLNDIASANLANVIFPESLLNKRLEAIDYSSHLKVEFPANHSIQPAAIPFSYRGHALTEDELIQGGHLVELIRRGEKEEEQTIGGWFQMKSMLHKLFPQEFQECNFIVQTYDNESVFDITSGDRERIKKQYSETFHRLRKAIDEAAREL